MNTTNIKTNSKINVRYIDLVADSDSEEMTVSLDELFKMALSMNDMGFTEGYETEYIIAKMVESNNNIIEVISDEYKLDLIEAWDYNILDILDGENESIKDAINRQIQDSAINIDEENVFKAFKNLNRNLAKIDNARFEIITTCLIGVLKHNEVYKALKSEMQTVIKDFINL